MAPGAEFARDFCAGIGPLQLGVVLVFNLHHNKNVYILIGNIYLYFDCTNKQLTLTVIGLKWQVS